MEFSLFALLPVALASFLDRTRARSTAGFGFLAALAPVIASGISQIVGHKKQQSAEKKAIEYERQQAAAEEAAQRAQFEAQANSPSAAMQRQSFNMKLGRLLGKAGGREKLPPSLLQAFDTARAMPSYTPGRGYIPKPTSGAGIWDILGGAGEALSYLDTTKFGKGKTPGQTPPIASTPTFQTGQLADYFKKKINPGFSSGTKNFG